MRLPALLVFAPCLAVAQAPFDPARVLARSDSFAVMVQGRQVGGIRETIEKTASGFRLVSVQALAGMNQSTEVFFSRSLAMTSVKQEGQARGQAMKIDVTYERGRAKGSSTTPGPQGMKTIAVDTTVPAGAVDDNALQSFLPALPLGVGKTFQVPVFSSGQGTSKVMSVAVTGSESVTVLAGTFEAWKVDVTGGQVPVTFWVAKTSPRVVKMGFAGAPMAFELVK